MSPLLDLCPGLLHEGCWGLGPWGGGKEAHVPSFPWCQLSVGRGHFILRAFAQAQGCRSNVGHELLTEPQSAARASFSVEEAVTSQAEMVKCSELWGGTVVSLRVGNLNCR